MNDKQTPEAHGTSNQEGLLPCPFCGTAPSFHSYSIGGKSYAWIKCEPCKIRKELHTDGESLKLQTFAMGAVTRWWNRRSSDETSALESAMIRLDEQTREIARLKDQLQMEREGHAVTAASLEDTLERRRAEETSEPRVDHL